MLTVGPFRSFYNSFCIPSGISLPWQLGCAIETGVAVEAEPDEAVEGESGDPACLLVA